MVLYLWRYVVPDPLNYTEAPSFFRCEKIIDDACSIIWCERYQEPGEIALVLRATPELLAFFWQAEIMITRDDTDRAMFVEDVVLTTSADNGDYIRITGKSAEGLTKRRVIRQRGAVTDMDAAAAIRYYMLENIGAYWYFHTDGEHQHGRNNPYCRMYVNLLTSGEDDERITEKISAEPFGKNLCDFITEICKGNEFGYQITFDGEKLVYRSYRGDDRTLNQGERNAVVFSEEFLNLGNSEYEFSRNEYYSHVIAGGSGTGSTREYGESFKQFRTSRGCGLNLWQKFINASGTSGNMLRIAAQNEVLASRETISFSAEAISTGQFKYRTDYNLGDRVSVVNRYGISGTATVTEVVETEDENGLYIIPALGMFDVQEYISPEKPVKPEPPEPPTPAIDPTKIAIFPLDRNTHERLFNFPFYANDYEEFRETSIAVIGDYYGSRWGVDWRMVEVIFGDLCGATNTDIEILYNGYYPSPDTPEPKLYNYIEKLTLNEGITRLINTESGNKARISFPSNCSGLKELTIPSTVESISYYNGTVYNFFNEYLAFPDIITIKKPQDSIPGAPWGATKATILWTG